MGQWTHLYKLKAWQDLRLWRLTVEPLCRMCAEHGQDTPASVVDHIIAHKGDMVLFLLSDNTQSLCKPCHDRHKQRAERAGFDVRVDEDGWPIDPSHPFLAPSGGVLVGLDDDGRVGSETIADRAGTGGGHSHAVTRNSKGKGK